MSSTNLNRTYKDTLFRFIFRQPEDLLALYNAVNDTQYEDVTKLEITTLEDIVYLSYKNDISFMIGNVMNLYEHQSSFNPNMPVRGLVYFGELYSQYIAGHDIDIYTSSQVKLPIPQYIVFYNGTRKEPEKCILKLSDAFYVTKNEAKEACIEVKVLMLNINLGYNKELMQRCEKLHQYAKFIALVRKYLSEGNVIDEAMDLAINDAIRQGILEELLTKQRAEVCKMFMRDYDEAKHMEHIKAEGIEEGIKEGIQEGIAVLIRDNLEEGKDMQVILQKLMKHFHLNEKEAGMYLEQYGK